MARARSSRARKLSGLGHEHFDAREHPGILQQRRTGAAEVSQGKGACNRSQASLCDMLMHCLRRSEVPSTQAAKRGTRIITFSDPIVIITAYCFRYGAIGPRKN